MPDLSPVFFLKRLWNGIVWLFSRAWRRSESNSSLTQDMREFRNDLQALADQITFNPSFQAILPIRNQFYGHGAFMGASPMLLSDERWRSILAFLMPDVYEQVHQKIVAGANGNDLIPMFENNPVMCAFGMWHGLQTRHQLSKEHAPGLYDLTGIEWDVFMDGDLVQAWLQTDTPEKKQATIEKLVDTMVIAHANTRDTVQEQLGFDQYQDVRQTSKSSLGGVEASAWLDLFLRSLELIHAPDLDAGIYTMSHLARFDYGDECQKHTFVEPFAGEQAVQRICELTQRAHFSLILEIKSLSSTPELLSAVVQELNRRGIHVAAVCSFQLSEIKGLSQMTQYLKEEVLPGPREILFFHFAGDVQITCDQGEMSQGQSLLFNGASLLELQTSGTQPYSVKRTVVQELGQYQQQWDLHMGLYVQENDCDATAASLLSRLVDEHSDIFDLGFAWGGLQNEALVASVTTELRDARGFGSQRMLEYIGKARHWQVKDIQ